MRLPRSLAWFLLVLTFFTAGLLRQFHEDIPRSPYAPALVGSLLFAAVFFVLLVAARERRVGAVRGPGVRLGSLTPILLMLLIEKWVSLTLYRPIFQAIQSSNVSPDLVDAQYRAFAGAGLLVICVLVGSFSVPAGRRVWRRSRPARWPLAAAGTAVAIVGTYLVLWGLGTAMGGSLRLWWPAVDALWLWAIGGQALRAFSEEAYYRGLLLFELQRLTPRLGVRSVVARRWIALLATSALFGMEHLMLDPSLMQSGRRLIFTVSLGLLLGIVVLVSANLHFAAGLHAWINWLLLGMMPRFVNDAGEPILEPGTYIGLSLALGFVVIFFAAARRQSRRG